MKKIVFILFSIFIFIGCKNDVPSSTQINPIEMEEVQGDAYSALENSLNELVQNENYSIGVNSSYILKKDDENQQLFGMDGVLEVDDIVHVAQTIHANGNYSKLEGYYYNDTLYADYNTVTYYEKMGMKEVKDTLLAPLEPYLFVKDKLVSISQGKDEDGLILFVMELEKDYAKEIFFDRYDKNDLKNLEDFSIEENQIVYCFDEEGHFIKESAQFVSSFKQNNEAMGLDYKLNTNRFMIGKTEVELSEEEKQAHSQYVNYQDIDVSQIAQSEERSDIGATIEETFRKRLVSRLNYEQDKDNQNVYHVEYNDNEGYTVDFDTKTFIYSRYGIDYSYNWKGDKGSMGKCTFDYQNSAQSDDCQKETVDTLKEIKTYLEMELYYCGLNLEELVKEL